MVSTFTPNIQLEEPARGDDVGTWDTPVNNNSTLLDLVAGGITTISLNNSNVTLSAAQFQSAGITLNSTLTGSVILTFPTSFKKPYFIQNQCTGSSAFTVTLQTTASGGQVICAPPGESIDVINDGTNLYFHNLGRVGEYIIIAGSSVPAWISGCTKAPYLTCDGSTFLSSVYPALAVRLGGTTLPDARGRGLAAMNQGTSRLVSSNGLDGNTLLAGSSADTQTLTKAQLPTDFTVGGTLSVASSAGVVTPVGANQNTAQFSGTGGGASLWQAWNQGATVSVLNMIATGSLTANNTSGQAHPIVQPTLVAGLTFIRAG